MFARLFLILSLLVLAACGRPLAPSETAYLQAIHGDQLDTGKMRIVDGHFAGSVTYQIPVRPRTTCQERIWPPQTKAKTVTVSPAATVLFNKTLYRKDLYSQDFMAGWPEQIDLFYAMLLAHEATHVWQWQNRARTGYHPLKALREHANSADPYLFDPDNTKSFLDYGYEQQGSIVEEYVCCRLLDPKAPRTARLRAMIAKEMPIDGLDRALGPGRVRLPWAGVQTEGICRGEGEAG
ncbi:hypothetical protein TRP8649_04270 [Pelagimonas phthalicica]|uniref:DUF4157 domain-containing protein n=1 Tax=Pelagimonas phthalicica TaxID=1037362 RepID=A0A238JHJ2_9RHOB|nr:hypothetical protein [Pelagimonas phthalicica]TDS89963.1 hypothetical protein CLV87_4017 [Pelagimonas phthalicica]SMX30130.1 hypothetical protein TRP8649_04270 [Pelagimonas phthalicica]